MNIILTGLQGSGKTTCGKLLAETLQIPFFDTDSIVLENHSDASSIRQLYTMVGHAQFRQLEVEALLLLQQQKNSVIALGGGTLLTKQAQSIATCLGTLIYLFLPKTHLRWDPHAQFLQGRDADELFEERHALFSKLCHYQIDVKALVQQEVVVSIVQMISQKSAQGVASGK